ncbi:hypothetical protein [Bacillus marinisedimentorum]|uniref:hypothetical protein n=1 Tax=Bacillus marinisedimentorum TaxID=1821260 RepID=UPI000872C45E|nr:hypothetical protein [Bacillus marinisedimentorum]
MNNWITMIFLLLLLAIHFSAQFVHSAEDNMKTKILSGAAGVSVAYIFLHLLPELMEQQRKLENDTNIFPFMDHHVNFIAVLGFITFYGLEKAAKVSRNKGEADQTEPGVFWVHMSSFFVYNALIGNLLVTRSKEETVLGLILYTVGVGLHFFVVDYTLTGHHKSQFTHMGRWILSSAIALGWLTGILEIFPPLLLSVLLSFLSGAIILNVMKEELPGERQASYSTFAAGAVVYMILLVTAGIFE